MKAGSSTEKMNKPIIAQERPDSDDARTLIAELDTYLTPLYPPESQHGLSVTALIAENVHFFVLRRGNDAAGCGGVKFYGREYAEIKRMYVRASFRGQGLGKRLLMHLETFTYGEGIPIIRLETGILQPEALRLYESQGYRSRSAFGEYEEDPLSLFYEKVLRDNDPSPAG